MTDLLLEVITAINIEGHKGRHSVQSNAFYNKVIKHVQISRTQYDKLISENFIPYSDRAQNRTALFIRHEGGRISLHKSTAKELRPFICLSLTKIPSDADTPTIICATKNLYPYFTTADKLKQKNLSGDQDFIDQTIRNILTSNYHNQPNKQILNRSIKNDKYTFSLTNEGKALAEQALDILIAERTSAFTDSISQLSSLSSQDTYTDEELDLLSKKTYTHKTSSNKNSNRRDTDDKLLRTAIQKNKCRCALNPEHITFAGANGLSNYLEGHHLIPLAAQSSFPNINLDRIENIVPLCPNCHQALHHGTLEVREALLTQLQELYSTGLTALGFSEEDIRLLLWRYYLCEK